MSDTVAAPSDTAVDTVTADAPDDPTVAEAQEFAAEQVAADVDQEQVSAIEEQRRWRRAQRRREGTITGWDGISQLTAGQLPSNSAGLIGRDPEKVAARENERSVPPFTDPRDAVLWVGGDPGRAEAVELSQAAKDDPDEELLDAVRATVGTDGADVRAERARAEGREEADVPDTVLSDGATKQELRDAAAARNPVAGSGVEPKDGPQPPGVPQRVESQQDRLRAAGDDAPTRGDVGSEEAEEQVREARRQQFAEWSEPETLAEQVDEAPVAVHAADDHPGGRNDEDAPTTALEPTADVHDDARDVADSQREQIDAELEAQDEALAAAAEAPTGVTGTDAAGPGDETAPTGITGTPDATAPLGPENPDDQADAAGDEYTREELEALGKDELLDIAAENQVSGRSRMTKDELVDALMDLPTE